MSNPTLVLCHIGTPVPAHIKTCIEQIRRFSDIPIHLIAEECPVDTDNFTFIPLHALDKHFMVRAMKKLPFKQDEPNPLWRAAALRFAYIAASADEHDYEEIIHFDNDVLVYKDPLELLPELARGNDISITECNDELLIAGFMYMRDYRTAMWLCQALHGQMELVDDNEMRLLRLIADDYPNYFSFLPMLPTMDRAAEFEGVFDCASWGQYVGGTHQEPGVAWAGDHHIVGRAITSGQVSVEWEDDEEGRSVPVCVTRKGDRHRIFNLHIHSKELDKYATQ